MFATRKRHLSLHRVGASTRVRSEGKWLLRRKRKGNAQRRGRRLPMGIDSRRGGAGRAPGGAPPYTSRRCTAIGNTTQFGDERGGGGLLISIAKR